MLRDCVANPGIKQVIVCFCEHCNPRVVIVASAHFGLLSSFGLVFPFLSAVPFLGFLYHLILANPVLIPAGEKNAVCLFSTNKEEMAWSRLPNEILFCYPDILMFCHVGSDK